MKKILLVLIAFSSFITYSQCTLNASFTFSASGGNVTFTNTSTNEPTIPFYQWDYNGQSSTMENPTFPQATTDEVVCFTVYDSTWSCFDSLCVLIPGDSLACNLNISWTQSISGNNITFTNTSTGEPAGATYNWLYNGIGSTQENPTFAYDSTISQVCFAISDPLGMCDDSICGPVYADSTGGCNLNISWTQSISGGMITFTNTSTGMPSPANFAWLYNGQSSGVENPTFTYNSSVTQVCFAIDDLSGGMCSDSICGPVYPDSTGGCNLVASFTHVVGGASISFTNTSTNEPVGAMYSWTFHGQTSNLEDPIFTQEPTDGYACLTVYDSTWNCYDSTCVFIPGFNGCNLIADFTLTIDSGYVYFTNTSTGEPIGANYDWWYGSQNSSLENPSFPLDSGVSYACLTVFDSAWNCYDSTCFLVDPASASIDDPSTILEATIYPNPVVNELFISVNSGQEIRLVEIYDASGRLVYSENSLNYDSTLRIDVNDLNSGVYIINIQGIDDNIRYTERFLKR